jgi:hypothetical protein
MLLEDGIFVFLPRASNASVGEGDREAVEGAMHAVAKRAPSVASHHLPQCNAPGEENKPVSPP